MSHPLKNKTSRWNFGQSRNRDTAIENKYMDTSGKGWGLDEFGDWDWRIYIIDTVYKIDN